MVIALCVLAVLMPLLAIGTFVLGYSVGCRAQKPIIKKKSKPTDLEKKLNAINDFTGW